MINVIFDSRESFPCTMIMIMIITYNESSLQIIYLNFKLEKNV